MSETSEIFLYLTTQGRKSGKAHKIEIWFVEHEGCYFLCSEHYEKSDWIQNSLKNPQVSFYLAARDEVFTEKQGLASIVEDESLIALLKQKFDDRYNWSDGLFLQICESETNS